MNTLGSRFRIALTALALGGLLAAALAVPNAIAANQDPQLEQLWKEFPLDDRAADANRARRQGDHPAGARAGRANPGATQPRSQPTLQREPAHEASDRSPEPAILAGALALLVGGSTLLLMRARPRRRSKETTEPAREQSGRRPAQSAATARLTSDRSRVVEALVAGLAEESPARKPKEVKMRSSTEGRQPSDPLALKEGGSERSGPSAAAQEALKRKSAAEAELLKAKSAGDPALLKEKLISGQRHEHTLKQIAPTPKTGQQPDQGRGRGELGKRRSLRPLRAAEFREPQPAARAGNGDATAVECEVRWWRGYVNSQFFAVQSGVDEPESVLGASPPFRWRKNEPPPQTPATAAALASLVDSFRREGWVVAGHGKEWFAVRLRRAKLHSAGPTAERLPIHANGGR